MKITFLHPDFGIGGAERLVLDAAIAMRQKGHKIKIVTNHFSRSHCFTELLSFEQDLEVVNWYFPRTLFNKCYALCAFIRLCIAAIYICLNHPDSDAIFCDQISAPLPILRLFLPNTSLLFYCHFPDQLLTKRESTWKSAYRAIIDRIEAWTLRWAHEILVNSHFTEGVVRQTFPSLVRRPLTVLYPSLNCRSFESQYQSIKEHKNEIANELKLGDKRIQQIEQGKIVLFLSINRFEVKKNIELAVNAFAKLRDLLASRGKDVDFDKCILILAGGYDRLNSENIAYHSHLVQIVDELALQRHVTFILSPSDLAKLWLFDKADMVVYTPDREHFGIVPVEAMFMRCPVLAVNSGGPLETIVDGKTGFLRAQCADEFAEVMLEAANNREQLRQMGEAGHVRVENCFSFTAFANHLDAILHIMHSQRSPQP